MKKLLSFLSVAAISTIALISPAVADYPNFASDNFRGSKGTYAVSYTAGTYHGCLFSGGCISLGKKQLIPCNGSADECENIQWKSGPYVYTVHDRDVWITKNGRKIFQDTGRN